MEWGKTNDPIKRRNMEIQFENNLLLGTRIVSAIMLIVWGGLTIIMYLELEAYLMQPQIMVRWLIFFIFPDLVFLIVAISSLSCEVQTTYALDDNGNLVAAVQEVEKEKGSAKKIIGGLVGLVVIGALIGYLVFHYSNSEPLRKEALKAMDISQGVNIMWEAIDLLGQEMEIRADLPEPGAEEASI